MSSSSTRIAFAPTELPAWAFAAKILEEDFGATITFWLSGVRCGTQKRVRELFPDSLYLSIDEALATPWRRFGRRNESRPVCTQLAVELYSHWDTILSLVARTPEWNELQYSAIRQRIYLLYASIRDIVLSERINMAIFSESPHGVPTYLLFVAAKSLSIPTYLFTTISLPDRIILTEQIGGPPLGIRESLDGISNDQVEELLYKDKAVNKFLNDVRLGPDLIPPYMARNHERERKATSLGFNLRHLRLLIDPSQHRYLLKEFWKRIRYRFVKDPREQLREKYEALASLSETEKPFILVALHYQPERTTNPEGGIYDEQSLVIRLISSAVPRGWLVYIKEHPTQFHRTFQGHVARTCEFYETASLLGNVRFLPTDSPVSRLLESASAVATVTGTIGLEAVLRGKPVIAFGSPWYEGLPGVFLVRTLFDVQKAISKIASQEVCIDQKKVDRHLAAVTKLAVRAYINPSNREGSQVPDEELIINLATAMERALRERGQKVLSARNPDPTKRTT